METFVWQSLTGPGTILFEPNRLLEVAKELRNGTGPVTRQQTIFWGRLGGEENTTDVSDVSMQCRSVH